MRNHRIAKRNIGAPGTKRAPLGMGTGASVCRNDRGCGLPRSLVLASCAHIRATEEAKRMARRRSIRRSENLCVGLTVEGRFCSRKPRAGHDTCSIHALASV